MSLLLLMLLTYIETLSSHKSQCGPQPIPYVSSPISRRSATVASMASALPPSFPAHQKIRKKGRKTFINRLSHFLKFTWTFHVSYDFNGLPNHRILREVKGNTWSVIDLIEVFESPPGWILYEIRVGGTVFFSGRFWSFVIRLFSGLVYYLLIHY